MEADRYPVQVEGLERAGDRRVVFHGVNKSGSLVMTNVLYDGYYDANRANQFFSTYRRVPTDLEHLKTILTHSTGHSFFGAHDLYDAFALTDKHVLTTQFRNPLPRARSCYDWLNNKAAAAGKPYPDFEAWVVASGGVGHSQVWQFGVGYAPGAAVVRHTISAEELFERSLVNIERDVQWFGIAEYMEESVFCMAAICGIPAVRAWRTDTRNANRPLVDEWPQEHVDLVREVYRWDFALYEWALERFHERLAGLTFGPALQDYKEACLDQYKDRLGADGKTVTEPAGPRRGWRSGDDTPKRQRSWLRRQR